MTKILLIILAIFSTINGFAQTKKLDSLKIEIDKHTLEDTTKVKLMIKYIRALNENNKNTSEYAEKTLECADRVGYALGKAEVFFILSQIEFRKQNYDASIEKVKKALEIYKTLGHNKGIVRSYTSLGNNYKVKGDYESCKRFYMEALEVSNLTNNEKIRGALLSNIGIMYSGYGEYDKATEFQKKSIEIFEKLGDTTSLISSLNNLGVVHRFQGKSTESLDCYMKSKNLCIKKNDSSFIINSLINISYIYILLRDYELAKNNIIEAINISKAINNPGKLSSSYAALASYYMNLDSCEIAKQTYILALETNKGPRAQFHTLVLTNLATLYLDELNYVKADSLLTKALEISIKGKQNRQLAKIYNKLGELEYKRNNIEKSFQYITKGINIGTEIKNIDSQKNGYDILTKIYIKKSDYKNAYLSLINYNKLSDSLMNYEKMREIAKIESAFEIENQKLKFENQIIEHRAKITSQRYITIIIIILAVLLSFIILALYTKAKYNKKQLSEKIKNQQNELKQNSSQLASATLKLLQSTEKDTQYMKLVEEIIEADSDKKNKLLEGLINHYKSQINKTSWEEFEIMFAHTNSNFYNILKDRFPSLTINERKICIFIKLNMSNKDISKITLQNEEAIKKARVRLRKKLGIERDTNLSDYIEKMN